MVNSPIRRNISRVRLTSNGLSVLVNFLKYGKFTYTQEYGPSQIDFKRVICLSHIFLIMVNSPVHGNMSQVRLTSNRLSVLVNFLKYGKFTYTQDYEPSQIDFKRVICLGQFSHIW